VVLLILNLIPLKNGENYATYCTEEGQKKYYFETSEKYLSIFPVGFNLLELCQSTTDHL